MLIDLLAISYPDSRGVGSNPLAKIAIDSSRSLAVKPIPQEQSEQPLGNKVEIISKIKPDNIAVTDYLPSRFDHKLIASYVAAAKTAAHQANLNVCANPNDFNLRCDYVYRLLLLAEIFKKFSKTAPLDVKREENTKSAANYVAMAKRECEQARNINVLDARYYYAEALVMEFEGVDCKSVIQVEEYIYLLQLALAFDPASVETKQTLDQAITFLRKKWMDLKQEGVITEVTYLEWTKKLEACLSQKVLKELFRKDPQLFKLSSIQTHVKFFKLHPELKSVNAFLEKYPETRGIELPNDELTKEGLQNSLAQAESNPLATDLIIIAKTAILTPAMANEIKDGMLNYSAKQKVLKVYVGNKEDATTINNAFKLDTNLIKGQGTLSCDVCKMKKEFSSALVYALFIPLDTPRVF